MGQSLSRRTRVTQKQEETPEIELDPSAPDDSFKLQEQQKQIQDFQQQLQQLKEEKEKQVQVLNEKEADIQDLNSRYQILCKTSTTERDQLLKECEAMKTTIESKDKIIAEKNQAIINAKASNDSSIVSSNSNDGSIRPQIVQEQFNLLMDSITDLQSTLRNELGSDSLDDSKRIVKNIYKKLLESLLDPGIWKILKKPMDTKKVTKHGVAMVLSGKQGDEKGLDKKELECLFQTHIGVHIQTMIDKEVGKEMKMIDPLVQECSRQSLLLAAHLVVSEPQMGIISPKKGSEFNPDKHEDATSEFRMVVELMKRPGLICKKDNKVFCKAFVETSNKST